MGLILKVTVEVTTDPSEWEPPEDVPTIRREEVLRQDPSAEIHIKPLNFVADARTRFSSMLDDAINEIVDLLE